MFATRNLNGFIKIIVIHSRRISFSTVYTPFNMKPFSTIGTHNGIFHCDEVLGCYMLKLLSPSSKIIRSRDLNILSECDIVIDVGGEYNPDRRRFDHHQKDFNHCMNSIVAGKPWTTKLSSAGLIYCHYGKEILRTILGNVEDEIIENVYDKVYEGFIQEIDGIDNGIPMYEGEPKYRIVTNLSQRISHLNQNWTQKDYDVDAAFNKAMDLAGGEFVDRVKFVANVWWPAKTIVMNALENRFKVHESGQVIELEEFCPWEEHLFQLESSMKISPTIKFLVFTDTNLNWRVRGVPVAPSSFVLRIPLKEEWRGLNGSDLSAASGIEDCIFVHSSGFIGGNKYRKGVIEMAVRTIKDSQGTC